MLKMPPTTSLVFYMLYTSKDLLNFTTADINKSLGNKRKSEN